MTAPSGMRLSPGCVVVGEGVVHYLESRPPRPSGASTVVLVHGVGVSGRNMAPTGEALADRCHVFVPDLPGFGKSSNPDHVLDTSELADALAAWMDAVGIDSAAVLGNSYGCQIAAEFAVRHPRRVERAVLQGPTIDPHARGFPRQFFRWLVNGMRERSTQSEVTFRDWRDAGFVRVVKTGMASLRHRIEECLPEIGVPVLVVRGTRDPAVPQGWAEEAASLLPDGRLALIPGAAHTITFNHPDELAEVVLPFLEEGAADRGASAP